MAKPYIFATPLVEGVIERRKSQFTMLVNYKGEVYSCHCPTTGRVGNIELAGRLCLMKELGVQPQAWGPFAEGQFGIFTHPTLTAIGEKYGKTAAQVALRWNVDRGVVVIPKSVKKERMAQNIDIWDFKLSDEDMADIAKMDMGHSEIIDHYKPSTVKMINGLRIHD